jgi:hypothetical protein
VTRRGSSRGRSVIRCISRLISPIIAVLWSLQCTISEKKRGAFFLMKCSTVACFQLFLVRREPFSRFSNLQKSLPLSLEQKVRICLHLPYLVQQTPRVKTETTACTGFHFVLCFPVCLLFFKVCKTFSNLSLTLLSRISYSAFTR